MAYSEALAERIRHILAGRGDVVEKRMFGGVAFMVQGRMACGPQGESLIVRIGEDAAARYIGEPHVKRMDFTRRVMKSFATIEPDGVKTDVQLRKWVLMAAEFAAQDTKKVKRTGKRSPRGKKS